MDSSILSWNVVNSGMVENPVVWAKRESLIILNVRRTIGLCGTLTIRHPLELAMEKSTRLKGSAMLALLGT